MSIKKEKELFLLILQNTKTGQRFLTGKYFSISNPEKLGKTISKIYGDVTIIKHAEWSRETFMVNAPTINEVKRWVKTKNT